MSEDIKRKEEERINKIEEPLYYQSTYGPLETEEIGRAIKEKMLQEKATLRDGLDK